jgi:outer membrane lipopolysaccharide assembly protein LptE/RlpB
MNRKLRNGVVAVALVGGLAACDNAPRNTATAPNNNNDTARNENRDMARNNRDMARNNGGPLTEPNRTSKGMDGSELENAVKAKLQSDEQLRNASINVSADAEKNAVTLSGTVPSQDARNKAVELAKSAHSGITVKDQIEVKPVG